MFQADDGPPDPLTGRMNRRNRKQDSIADLSPSKRIGGSLASHFHAIRDIFFRRRLRAGLFVSVAGKCLIRPRRQRRHVAVSARNLATRILECEQRKMRASTDSRRTPEDGQPGARAPPLARDNGKRHAAGSSPFQFPEGMTCARPKRRA
jgi:hypothetical protein